jgi:hypothetical protein
VSGGNGGLANLQRTNLYGGGTNASIVGVRTQIATLLRSLLATSTDATAVQAQVLALSGIYGDLDGANNCAYATVFTAVYKTLSTAQKAKLLELRRSIMSGTYADGTPFDFTTCTTPFLYSSPISTSDTDYISNTSDAATDPLFTITQNG